VNFSLPAPSRLGENVVDLTIQRRIADKQNMTLMAKLLRGQRIDDVFVDAEVVYIMLADGTQVTINGLVVVAPKESIIEDRIEALS